MYAPFFGLAREPFSIAPDPHFLYMSEAHREALAHLLYGLGGGGGFVLLTGEIGAGKTTVCRCFLDQVPEHCDVAYVFNPKLGAIELLQTVCEEFRIDAAIAVTIKDYVDALNDFLLRSHAAGRHAVLIIDEAQSLSAEVLEQLRLLTNLETSERKLLQIILIGQPELRDMLARPELEQLAQRVIARYHLPALTEDETTQYMRHRLSIAGLAGEMPFDARALHRLHQLCGGVPRRINLLAGRALLGGYAVGRAHIDRKIVDTAAQEVFGTPPPASPRPLLMSLGALALLAVGAGIVYALQRPAQVTVAPAAAASATHAPTARAAAAGGASAAASAPATVADAAALGSRALRTEGQGWRELAALWGVEVGDGDPCGAVQRQQPTCFRSSGGLAQVREIGRPSLLTLRDAQQRPSYAVLTGLDDANATLSVGGTSMVVPLAELAALWRGEFAVFWRPPPGWREGGAEPPPAALAGWLDGALPRRGQALKPRIVAFQVAHGLKPDGVAGPMTLMQINRASGVEEPRLQH